MKFYQLSEVFEAHTQINYTNWAEYHSGIRSQRWCYVDYIPFELEEREIEIVKVTAANRLFVILRGDMPDDK